MLERLSNLEPERLLALVGLPVKLLQPATSEALPTAWLANLARYLAGQFGWGDAVRSRLDSGEVLPDELDEIARMSIDEARTKQAIREMLGEDRMIPKEAYLHVGQIIKELKRYDPAILGGLADPTNTDSLKQNKMIRIFLWHRLKDDDRVRVTALSAQEAFIVYIKASLLSGVVLASPFIFYFMWSFVASGLYPHEKSYVYIFGPISLGLFVAGAMLAFFVVFQYVLKFLLGINAWVMIDLDPRISEWIGFAMMLPIGFGVSFQLPLLMLFLERIGIFTVAIYWEKWRIAVLVIAVLSMLLTPADPMSMILMAAPLTLLYFGGIGFCRFMPKRKSPFRNTID